MTITQKEKIMMKQIKIFNVNFGDCFLCESPESNAAMLVDFGSTKKIGNGVVNAVNLNLRSYEKKYLMISHFHNDHYSGIRSLSHGIVFDEVYLPNFFTDEVIRLELIILAVLSESNQAHEVALNLLSVVPDLLNHLNELSRINYVKRKEYIVNSIDSYRVLWPDITDFNGAATVLFDDLVHYYNLTEKLEEFYRLVRRYLNLFPTLQDSEHSFMQFTEEFLVRRQGVKEEAEDIKKRIINLFKENKASVKRLSSKLSKRLSAFQNKISICFDNAVNGNGSMKPVLFLGDITRDNFNKISSPTDGFNLACEYKAIKVAHHGTKDYFVNNLPKSEYMIISNGKANNDSWRISPLYGWHYNERNFICTNYTDACDYEFANKSCDASCNNASVCGINFHNVYYVLSL